MAGKPSTSCNRFQASSMLENMAKAQVVSPILSNVYLRKQNKDNTLTVHKIQFFLLILYISKEIYSII